jgi:hypothetical protein
MIVGVLRESISTRRLQKVQRLGVIPAIDYRCGPAGIGVQIFHSRLDILVPHKAAAKERSNENKHWLRTFAEYVGGLLGREMRYSNRVFVVSFGGKGDGWKISYKDVVEQKNRYFFPVGSRWPDPPPNYLAFRYDGKLQSIRHVKSYTTFTRPSTLFPEAPKGKCGLCITA